MDDTKDQLQPKLQTERLILRPFLQNDAKKVRILAGHLEVAASTASIPHPYPEGTAEDWIKCHTEWFKKGHASVFAITLKSSGEIIGCIDISGISKDFSKGEMGYWVGFEYWNNGYATEAATTLIKFGFQVLQLNKITSRHMSANPASGKVMLNVGMSKEGTLRQELRKNKIFHDIEVYGILREKFLNTVLPK